MTPSDILSTLEIPDWDTASAIKPSEAEFIYSFIKEHNLSKTLEVGFAFSMSASHIMAATEKPHIACDPFQDNYKQMGLQNVKKLGLDSQLDFRPEFSHDLLPKLKNEGKKFDFIFIDGDHKFDGILIDFYYSHFLLEKGGYVMLHDTWMRSTRLIEKFIVKNRKEYVQVPSPLRNIIVFKKIDEDQRDGMFFSEFYTTKSIVVHSAINYMNSGKNNFFKKMLMSLKSKLK